MISYPPFPRVLAYSWCIVGLLFVALPDAVALVDLNHNGRSDLWELEHGATGLVGDGDADGDGASDTDEATSGTNPFSPASHFVIPATRIEAGELVLEWEGVPGKIYQLQSNSGLDAAGWTNAGDPILMHDHGGGSSLAARVPFNPSVPGFFRVTVSDQDDDGDGLNDWEEDWLGLSHLRVDSDSDGVSDYDETVTALGSANTVAIIAAQPFASEDGPASGMLTITRSGNLNGLTVPLSVNGNAGAGVDYDALPASVFIPPGKHSVSLVVHPIADTVAESGELVSVVVQAAAGYALGTNTQGDVVITDATAPQGDGLAATYWDNSSSTYSNSANFSGVSVSRVDPVIDFDWGNPEAVPPTGIGTPDSGIQPNSFSARWTGQIQPQYSENYTFVTRANDGEKLWVNGQLIVDAWNTTNTNDISGTIALEAGVRYDIKMEYFESSGSANVRLSWYSPSQPKQVIPQNRLYSSAAAPAGVGGGGDAVGVVGAPFAYLVSGINGATDFAVTGLPPGLDYDPLTKKISGLPSVAGLYHVRLQGTGPSGVGYRILRVTIVEAGGAITHETWNTLTGPGLGGIPTSSAPSSSDTLSPLQATSDSGENYGRRLRGYITPYVSGNHQFWISAADVAELWISSDDQPVNKVLRASVPAPVGVGVWEATASQKSLLISLEAGERYYVEVLHRANTGPDHLAVGWRPPGAVGAGPLEVIPGYALSPYVEPTVEVGTSTLYVATLTPQGAAASSGAGVATLRVDADKTSAIFRLTYGNLTGPVTSQHIHDASRSAAILFDIDEAEPDANGDMHWEFAPTGNHTVEDIIAAIESGVSYVNIHTALYPSGEIKGFFRLAEGSQVFTPPADPPALPGGVPTDAQAARLLQQATYGPDDASINLVKSSGYAAWIDAQMGLAPSSLLADVDEYYAAHPADVESVNQFRQAWWDLSCSAPDQLRQRVAFALSEIFVVSEVGVLSGRARALASYYDTLAANAFGNYRDLLEAVTLHPAMGLYLDMRRNDKPDITIGRSPNENYGREVLQLFSIGLRKLHPDGTLKLDRDGLPIATYGQEEVVGFAHVFTGWNYYASPPNWNAAANYVDPMALLPDHHDSGEKRVLDRYVLAAGQGGDTDLQQALDVIFEHPNVGPFICRQLIQRLVTGNPSPGYIYRVAKVFADNGSGERGDMGAVVKAILLDYEARADTVAAGVAYGHQREPLLRLTALARACHGFSNSGEYIASTTDSDLGQTPMRSPTVFNYFEPDYSFPGEIGAAGLYSPEFQISSETTVVTSHNLMRSGIFNSDGVIGAGGTGFKSDLELNLATEKALAHTVPALVEHLNRLLLAGKMSSGLRSLVEGFVLTRQLRLGTSNEDADRLDRARSAVHLVVTSPEFCVQK